MITEELHTGNLSLSGLAKEGWGARRGFLGTAGGAEGVWKIVTGGGKTGTKPCWLLIAVSELNLTGPWTVEMQPKLDARSLLASGTRERMEGGPGDGINSSSRFTGARVLDGKLGGANV